MPSENIWERGKRKGEKRVNYRGERTGDRRACVDQFARHADIAVDDALQEKKKKGGEKRTGYARSWENFRGSIRRSYDSVRGEKKREKGERGGGEEWDLWKGRGEGEEKRGSEPASKSLLCSLP